ncbi:MAG: DUF3592 domain-containing protein [Cyclobacteriaceae bacterium]|nr:DUF3592 domain-containing protein [Cyclobacteriaceae bacterium]
MKSGCGTVFIFFIGFLGFAILYMAVSQYLIKGESLHDHGIPITAVVLDTLIVHEKVAGNYRAPFSTPVIRYTVEGKTITDTASKWSYRLDTENITFQSNSLLLPGDTLELLVNPNDPDVYIQAGESDDTNIVGFAIWGTIGLALIIPFLLRLKKLFPKDAEQRQWEN